MKYGILGDVHANLEALEAVARCLEREGVERVLCVGDVVGYGASPAECIELLRARGVLCVLGNHDAAVADRLDPSDFNPPARKAVAWTRATLRRAQRRWLSELPLILEEEDFALAHGTYSRPERFDYVTRPSDADASLAAMRAPTCFIGHTHVPVTMLRAEPGSKRTRREVDPALDLRAVHRALVNVGSVGQPRDGDPRAAFAVYDGATRALRIERIAYDVESAAGRIRAAGLPEVLADRLHSGL